MAARGEGFHTRAGYRRSSIARHLWKTTALTSLALALSGAAAYGDDAGLWQPQVRAIIGADNNGGNAALEGFIPIKQTAESVLFLDVRAKHDFKDAFGQDIGLGIRRIVNPDLMLGGYAYFNAESYGGTQFTGGTLGVEAITPNFDAHVNVFVPIKGDSTGHSVGSTLSMVSNQLIEQISVLDHRDYAAWGIEGEVGAKVPLNLPDKHSLRLDIGGYHFEDPHGDDGSVTGAKAGIEYEIGDVFGTGTSLTFTGEVRNDNRDDTQFAGSVRLNIPFNPGGGSDNTAAIGGAEPVYPVSEGLRKRVNERVRGDIGVRIQSQDKTGGSTTRVAINAATNAAFGKFYFADGGLAGVGTQADPTTLDDAVTKAGAGGFVVALGGNGNLTTAGVTLATGQTVIGGGESVTAKLFDGGTATFNLGGSDGTIQGTNVANNVITLGNGNTLNGITITGGADGIFGNNVTGTTLTKVTVTGAGGNGADFTGNSTNVSASNFTATGNGLDGLHIEGNGTYNFTGTTLLQSNLDDGLDITGAGTYTFATVNALGNVDRGITVQGSGGSFTTTGGNISGNGGIGIYIDPITAHVVLDSISQTGGTSGVVLDHVSGSFTVNGATTISGTSGPAIAISDSPAAIRFGDVSITTPAGDGMVFSGVNAAVVAGNIVISGLGLGHTGLDFSGSQTTFTALSANISGSGAGSIGIDLADTTGDASIIITNGGTISGVDTGVRLGIAGSLAHSANAQFSFGGGSIAGITASLDARGLNQTLGHYGFGSTTFSGPQLFDVQNVIFVGAAASGSGDGSSLGNLASIGTADGISDSNAIFVLVNDAGNTPIDATGGFSLSAGQTLASFGNGRSFSLGGVPINVTGANIQHDVVVSDPGTGAATLTNSGAGAVVTAASGGTLEDFNISGGSGAAISGSGSSALTVQGVTVSSVATGLSLNGFSGTGTFTNFDITSAGTGVSITGGTTGTLTFDAASSITGTSGVAFNIDSSTPNLTYNGTINQTAASSAVKINAMTGGSATFGGKITASTGAANAIDLTGNTGSTINFTGGLDLTTDGGYGFSAVNGGTLTVTGSGNTVNTGAGVTENGIHLGGAGGLTIGAAGVTFASVTVDGSGGSVPAGIVIENTSGGNVTFGGVSISRANGDAIRLTNVASGTYSFNGTTTIAAVGGAGPGFVVQGSAATVSVNNLVTTNVSGADVSLTNNTGTIGIGGTITNSGAGDGVVVSGGSAAITVSAAIFSSPGTTGTAVKVDGITGGSVAFTGSVTSAGTGNLFAIGSTTAPTGGAINFTGSALTASGGGGAVIAGLGTAATFNATAPLSITNATGNGVSVSNVAGSATFGAVTVTTAGGNGIDISGNSGAVTFGTTNVTLGAAANTAGINFSGTNAGVTFGTTTVSNVGANQTGIDFSGSSTTAALGLTTITGTGDLTSRGIDLSSTTGNKTITFLAGSSISNAGVGVELASDHSTATSANANFTFGDGTSANGLQSSITAAAGGYTVNTVGLNPALGNYNFNDVSFTGSANLASAVGGVIMVSQNGGVIAAGTDGLSADVTTISVAAADAMAGTQTFAFVGTVDLSGTPFTLDSGQSITGFGNNTSILTSGTIQPVNVQGNLGATGGNVTGNEGVVTGSGGFLHLLGSNQVRNTAFDFTGASGSVFTIDQNALGFSNAGGIVIDGVTVSNVAAGSVVFKVVDVDTNVSITNNNISVAGTLLDANGGAGNITLTRGTLPNSATPGTLTGGGISIANRSGGLVNFTDKVTVGGNGVSLTSNTGSTVTFADVDITTNGATAFTATGGGTVNVTTGTVNATGAQAVALDGITAGINFASTSATFSSGNGIDLQNLSGTAAFGSGTLTNTGSGTAFNVGSATNLSGGNAAISYGGTIASNGTGASVSIQELTGGSVTLSGNLTDGNAAAGGNIVVAGIGNGTAAAVTFSGTTKQISSGATDAVSLIGNPNGTVDFSNGGLAIKTTGGTGFGASTGTVSVTGPGNTITTTTSTALNLDGATVGAGGFTFGSVSVNGAATGIALNNVSGGSIGLGVVDLQGITSRGVDISSTLGATLNFTSLNIGLGAANAVGLDLNGAALGASNITAGDFDVDGGSFAGTIGIDMAGTTGTGTIQLGDTVNNNPGPSGQTSTISNVGYGVQFSSATNAQLVFGDGQGPAESSIATTGGQVIHATDSLPLSGDYNFNDVTFTGDTSNLSSISVYYVTEGGTGDGSLANPGSYAGAQASTTANVIVLIDKTVDASQSTIDLGGTSFQLDDGQVLLAFKSGDAAIDVSQLGVDTTGGAGAAFHFTTVQNSPIVSAPGGIDSLRPILQSNNAISVVSLATSGTGLITGGVQNLIIRNIGTGDGIAVSATAASSFFLRNNDIAAGGSALDFATTGAPANTLLLSIDGNTLKSTGSALAASFVGQNINATDNSIAIRSFAGNKVTGGTGGGIAFNNVRFDSDGLGGTVSVGTLDIGTTGARVQGDGLNLTSTSGTLDLGTFTIANNSGTGLLVDTKTAGTNFTLNSSGGSVDTTGGAAFNLDPLTVNMTIGSVTAAGGTSGIIFDGVAGTFTVTGATTITGTSGDGISAINTNTGTFNFNTVTVNNALTSGGGIGWASGTLTVSGLANIDTTSGTGLTQGGGTTSFTGGLTIDTTSGTGILGSGGTMAIAATAGAETVNSTSGQAIGLTSVAANIALDSTSSGGGSVNVNLINTSGTIDLGSGALTGAAAVSFLVNGGTAAVSYSGSATISNAAGTALEVQNRLAGAGLVSLSGNLTSNGNGIFLNNNAGGTVTASGASNNFTGAGTGITLINNTSGTFNINGASYTIGMSSTGAGVAISGNSSPVVMNFGGGLAITTAAGTGFSATGAGTLNVTGSGNMISTGTGTALNLNGVTVGTGGVNFSTVSTTGAATGIALANVASSGGGTIALGTVNLQGITSLGVDVSGTLGAALSFNSLAIGLNSSTATAFDLSNATINAAVTANDFDVTNAAAGAGTSIGVDLRGASGGQTVRFGDAAVGGNSSSIAGVNTAVFLNSATNLAFTFGDGESATDQNSTISATTDIDATNAPTLGTYNFKDVNFQSSPGNGFGIGRIFFVGASATGNGSGKDQSNLISLTGVQFQATTNDVIVLVNDQGVITATGSLVLQTGEQVRGFGNGNINLALTVPSTIQLASNSISIIDQTPNGAATLSASAGIDAIRLGASGNIIDGFILDGGARGIKDNGSGASGTTISHMTIRNFTAAGIEITPSTSTTIDNVTFSGNATDVILNASNSTIANVTSTGATGIAFDLRNTTGTTTLTNLNITTAASGTGIVFGGASGPGGTITGTNVDISGGSGISVVGGNAAISFDGASSIAAGGSGTAASITNRTGGSFAFAGTVTANGGASGIVISGATGASDVSFTGAVDLGVGTTMTGTAVSINNNAQSSVVAFSNLDVVTNGTTGFSATGGGTVNVTTGTVSSTGAQAVNLNGVATSTGINFTSTTSTGGASNVSLTNVTGAGAVSLGSGALSGASGTAFLVSGGSNNVSYAGTIAKTSAGNVVSVSSHTGSTTTFSGTISATGSSGGIALANNTGAIINFTNTLTLTGTNTTGFSATGGGTVSATGSGSIISSGTATALNVANTTIGSGGLKFQSISAIGSSGNAGIVLDTTGSLGGLTVSGTGTAGSGGVISNKTGGDILTGSDASGQTVSGSGGTGIFLRNTSGASFTNMQLNDFSNFAVYGNNVTGFTLASSVVNGVNGTNNAGDREESSIRFDNLLGTASITGSSISGGFNQNIDLYNTSGTLTRLTMDNNTFGLVGSTGNDNVSGQVFNSATANYTLTNSTFAGTRSDFIAFLANNNATMDAVVRSNTFHNGQAIVPGGGTAVDIRSGSGGLTSAATTTFDISHNILTDGGANAFDTVGIFVAKGQDNGTMSGTIASNAIGPAKVNSNSDGIFVRSAGTGTLTTLIQNNTITGVGNNGIHLQNNDGSATMNATIYGNTVSSPTSSFPFAALLVDNGATATDTSTTNVVIGTGTGGAGSKNTLTHNALYAVDVSLSNFNANTHLNLSRNGSAQSTAQGVIGDDNNGSPIVDTTGGSGAITFVNTLPTLPAVVAP
ncbi:S-layer family protein [Mesorhizobium sp. SARCC-RB16n]|uniref:beta strand repeat-containing protein n=1 Tax=Mesorhizobium sp. SARCC-RB16n TaxID=2116687 RepID=UPI00166F5F62|nr:S-layer family protein [Mesorhizobium sp. SARCC-RB16n]